MSPDAPSARILVIDDEEVIHASLKRLLGRQGHTIDSALSAPQGLELLAGQHYDMVISDLMMPEMTGLELLQKLVELQIKVPVLMITGYPTIKTALKALRLGAVDYLAKPFTRQELLGPVERTLRRSQQPAGEVQHEPRTSPQGAGPRPQVGSRFLLRDHAWAVTNQDGTVSIGVVKSFLDAIDKVDSVLLPQESELLQQGYVGIRLRTESSMEHGVLMPLSGQVMAVNDAAASPGKVDEVLWLVKMLPSNLEAELPMLALDPGS